MFLSNSSVARPVAMTCLIIGLSLLGMNAYRKLGLELMPKMDIPMATIVTTYPGATPSDIEVDVAKRIEDAVASIDGLKHITSTSMENVCQTSIEFILGTDIDVACNDVRQKIDAILNDFPEGVENPVILKIDINAQPIITLSLTGDLPVESLYDYADQVLSDRLSSIPGVANVDLTGGAEREVHIVLDRDKVSAAGLSSLNVAEAVQTGVVTMPAGRIRDGGYEYGVRFDAEYKASEAIANLQVAGKNGARRYIRDLGHVEMASDEVRQASFIDGRRGIGIQIVKRSDANAVEVVRLVRKSIDGIRALLPGGMELVWVTDDGDFTEASFLSTRDNIISGIVLTGLILFFFLFNIRSALVVAVSMPLTIIISLFMLQLSGFTLNNSTLLALGLSVGTLVTNSIVVLESITAQFEAGMPPWEAAKRGAADVAVAVMASAGTNVVVLLPIGIMGSMVGMFFRPFALTTLYANVMSMFISFTMTPILCGVFLKVQSEKSWTFRIGRWFNGKMDWLAHKTATGLRACGRHRWLGGLIILLSIGVLVHALSMAGVIGFAMFPETDRGKVFVKLEYPTQQNLARTIERVKEVEEIVKANIPDINHIYTDVGKVKAATGNPSEGVYLAAITIVLPNKTERTFGVQDVMRKISSVMSAYPDCVVTPSLPNLIGQESVPINLGVSGEDIERLEAITGRLRAMLMQDSRFVLPSTSARSPKQEILVQPNRALLADAGLTPAVLGGMIRTNIEGTKPAQFKSAARSYNIRVKFEDKPGTKQVEEFQVPLADGKTVMLSQYAAITSKPSPILITRYDKMRMSVLFSFLEEGFPLGTAMDEIRGMIADNPELLPPGYTANFMGMGEMMGEAIAEFLEAAIIAIVLTYLTLAAVLESFTRPFYIMATIPLGLIGIMWALRLTGTAMDIFVLLGAVLLIGIVVNNAVLVIDHMQQLAKEGMNEGEAMLQAITLELRPIIMITIAAVLGMLPLAVASGLGGEMTSPIGIASVGGIIVSGVLTLFVIPVAFMFFNPPPARINEAQERAIEEKVRRTSTRMFLK